jgi:hypothetical protein
MEVRAMAGVVTRLLMRARRLLGLGPALKVVPVQMAQQQQRQAPTRAPTPAKAAERVPTKTEAEAILAEPLPRGRPTKAATERREMARQVMLGLLPAGMEKTAAKAKMEQNRKTAKPRRKAATR